MKKKKKTQQHITLTWDRHTNVVGLNRFTRFQLM